MQNGSNGTRRTVVLDLDGTLADTSADLIASANACFRALGRGEPLDPLKDALTAFHGGRAMLRLGFERLDGQSAEAEIDLQYPLLLENYRCAINVHTTLYPGARDAVERLRAEGFATAICTNKPEALAETLLSLLEVRHLFDAMIGADTLPVRKPDPAPYVASVERAGGAVAHSMLVGDTRTDRDTARAAGVPVALVTFGPSGMDVAELGPDGLLHHFDELPDLAARLLG
ncbi:HAD hydrolase-like protein [Rhodobacter sphaeroides]|jgi:haloacid dehalogenase superfamily, subfamily IA, variant 3 with third motif having DD or ED|uniref:phosphoglycolate phosphatase n=1 Tax=Cereibacter sphaeroides (strain ATCC 17023 / DSM 158 / JCM 6121 / CCUG 31486 / LMG 2827 / NBRC 12203 / NCIMB 8253 / ATH 2.4.1.) TaxID=272943 RepID=Q3J3G9_CERS4|nr:phosphoglycolate phosphatase [Cereibacter sphaeroides]ABA78665.1 phosphoglycolate phosphatase [Cereibacter sphaeroides 2.4.1]AMJ47005.1 haloacid dehalogenase [Cereibacter sphaeroides]ANS33719.1 haloacid dehalogenase [Cereibacter sphaeroides]ATN62762.1 haloacid dehalogenase [Cereibacter sphaeroides]AXC60878.1 phosphoglycolate phosphatase [Cereibacter sphaeroides 2.4.1]